MENRWYVYQHVDGDEVIYVGMGKDGRAFQGRDGEHGKWMSRMNAIGISHVRFVKFGMSKKEAETLEADLCRSLQPKYNKIYNVEFHAKHSERMKKLWEEGKFEKRVLPDMRGGNNPNPKTLKDNQVREIKYLLSQGCKTSEIIKKVDFPVGQSTIARIRRNVRYQHII